MDKQSIIRHFCSISFNTGLLCSILLSICILKSHGSLLLVDSYTGCGSWLLYGESYMYTGCGSCNTRKVICHPCHNPAFHIQDKPQCVDCTILSSLQHWHCFWASFLHPGQYNMANCLITLSAILHSAGTFCLSMVFIILVLKACSCAAIIISSVSIFSQFRAVL